MSRCYALTKDYKPCRMYGSILTTTDDLTLYSPCCRQHSSLTLKPKKRSLEWNLTFYNYTKRLLEDGVYETGHKDFQELTQPPNILMRPYKFTHFIVLSAKYSNFKKEWVHEEFYKAALRQLWWQMYAVGPVFVCHNDLFAVASSQTDPIQAMADFLSSFTHAQMDEPEVPEYLRLLGLYVQTEKGEAALLHPDLFRSLLGKMWPSRLNAQALITSGILIETLKQLKNIFYTEKKKIVATFKEELMMYCWHPCRYEQRLDIQELAWLKSG